MPRATFELRRGAGERERRGMAGGPTRRTRRQHRAMNACKCMSRTDGEQLTRKVARQALRHSSHATAPNNPATPQHHTAQQGGQSSHCQMSSRAWGVDGAGQHAGSHTASASSKGTYLRQGGVLATSPQKAHALPRQGIMQGLQARALVRVWVNYVFGGLPFMGRGGGGPTSPHRPRPPRHWRRPAPPLHLPCPRRAGPCPA